MHAVEIVDLSRQIGLLRALDSREEIAVLPESLAQLTDHGVVDPHRRKIRIPGDLVKPIMKAVEPSTLASVERPFDEEADQEGVAHGRSILRPEIAQVLAIEIVNGAMI